MDIVIRDMQPSDYADVISIWENELGKLGVTLEGFAAKQRRMDESGMYHTFVAELNGVVAGMITCVEVLSVDYPIGYMKMNGLAVKREYHRKGVGRALIYRVEAMARERGLSVVGLATGVSRKEAHKFYERLGYARNSYWYSKRPDSKPER